MGFFGLFFILAPHLGILPWEVANGDVGSAIEKGFMWPQCNTSK